MKKKKASWTQYISLVFFVLLGVACGMLITAFMDKYSDSLPLGELPSLILLFAVFYASIFLQLIIHEAGHLVFGLISGYGFCSFRVFSFMFVKEDGKLCVKRLTVAGTGGQCLMSPPELQDGKMPVILYNLGGSIMNIGISALCMLMQVFVPYPMLSVVLMIFALSGAIIGLMNGIPMRLGGVDNDGYNAISLGRSPKALKAFWIQLKVNELQTAGARLRDMPEEWFTVPTDEEMQNSIVASVGVFACNRLMDMGMLTEAYTLMRRLTDADTAMVGVHRSLLTCEMIFCRLMLDEAPDAAYELLTPELKKFMEQMRSFPSVLRTEYALALSRGDRENASKVRAAFTKIAPGYPFAGDLESETELMEKAKKRFE